MKPMLCDTTRRGLLTAAQIGLLAALSEVGYQVAGRFELPLPGNLVGMILLSALLATGMIRLRRIEGGASVLLRHLAFFFVPIAVGIMSFGELLRSSGLVLLVVLLVSTLAGIIVAGRVTQMLKQSRERAQAGAPNGSRMDAT